MPDNQPGSRLVFKVLYGPWSAGDFGPYVDEASVDDPHPDLVKAAGSAHAAGVLHVSEGLDESHVESQEASEEKLAEAMGDHVVKDLSDGTRVSYWTGPWQEGNCLDYMATRGALLARHDDPEDEFKYDDATAESIRSGIAGAQKQLDHWRAAQESEAA
jgi:hypothetical protein